MKAAIFDAFGAALELRQVPDPVCPPHGAVIKVQATGVCRSDWHAWTGHDPSIRLPHVPGHELSGVIAELGKEVKTWQLGERVTTPFCGGCGACRECLAGQQHICDNDYQPGFSGWGSFAQYVVIPNADINLVRLPEGLGFVEAASLGCRFMTAFRAVVQQGRLTGGEYLAVHGCGGVGLSAVMIAAALGATVVAVDIDDAKLELAQTLGARYTINAKQGAVYKRIRELSDGGSHVSVDALGSHISCRNSILSLRKRGRHIQIGLLLAEQANPPLPMHAVIAKELQIYGSHGMPAHAYPEMFSMISGGLLEPARLLGETIPLSEAGTALAAMTTYGGVGVTVINKFD